MQLQQNQLLQIVKEELIKKSKEKHVEKVIPLLTPDIVQYMIINDLPIYENHLKELIFDQSKEKIGTVIQDINYSNNLRAQQDELERQMFLKKTEKRKKKLKLLQQNNPEIFLQKTLNQPQTQMEQLQNNFATLLTNFTQVIAGQVVQQINQKQNKSKKHSKKIKKRPSTPEFEQSQESQDQNDQPQKQQQQQQQQQNNIILMNQQEFENQNDFEQLSELSQENSLYNNSYFQQKNIISQSNMNQEIRKNNQQNQQIISKINKQELQEEESQSKLKYPGSNLFVPEQKDFSSGELESNDEIDTLPNNKKKLNNNQSIFKQQQQQQSQSQLYQSSEDYPDDFIEESNDKFSQNVSNNFYKPKQQQQQKEQIPEQVDFDDDYEDLLY